MTYVSLPENDVKLYAHMQHNMQPFYPPFSTGLPHFLDLDLDSTRIHALGHSSTPFLSVKSCHLCFFPGERHLSQIFLGCAYPVSSWSTWSSLETWTSQYSACIRRWSIRRTWPSQRSLLSLSMFSMLCCPVLVLTSAFVTLSFHEIPNILLCHLWCAASSFFVSVADNGHSYALYKKVDRTIDSYSLPVTKKSKTFPVLSMTAKTFFLIIV